MEELLDEAGLGLFTAEGELGNIPRTGQMDGLAVIGQIIAHDINGPVMVECCALGDTPEIVTANARKNREYLEKVFAAL